MYDLSLAMHVLEQIHTSTQTILDRFEPVDSVSYFTDSPAGMENLIQFVCNS